MTKTSARLNIPTILTLLRMALAVLFFIFMLIPETWAYIVALVIFIVAAITDKIDGSLARKYKQVTDLGAFLDPLADKMLVNLALLILVYFDLVPIWVFAIILVRDFAVDGLRMNLAKSGKALPASKFGKFKTATQMTAIIILLLAAILRSTIPVPSDQISSYVIFVGWTVVIGDVFLYCSLALTVFSGANYLVKGCRQSIKTKPTKK